MIALIAVLVSVFVVAPLVAVLLNQRGIIPVLTRWKNRRAAKVFFWVSSPLILVLYTAIAAGRGASEVMREEWDAWQELREPPEP